MNALFIILVSYLGYFLAYHTYGKFFASRIFKLDNKRVVPAKTYEDGCDYVPSKKMLVFGHHFTSIAGTGPIVGPAIGVIWGWGPALLWIFFGAIFMGAVHDFSALVISLRHEGQSISTIIGDYTNRRVKFMVYLLVFLAVWIVLAIFGLVIALIFAKFPESVWPVWAEIPIAMGLGYRVHKKGGSLIAPTIVALVLMYITVFLGHYIPFHMGSFWGFPATGVWTVILLIYAYVASVLPVNILLQPRDYINAWQLFLALGLLLAGVVFTAVKEPFLMTAPVLNLTPKGAPAIAPFLFITISCGAISGFHSLVSSGTTAKQLSQETDAQCVGYGAMLVEAALAILVLVAVTAGLSLGYPGEFGNIMSGLEAWQSHYGSWESSAGLGSKLSAVVIGSANIMQGIGISHGVGLVIMGVFIASFAGTTLDTATRIQRYVITEICIQLKWPQLANKWVATAIAIGTAALLAFSSGMNGQGALALWPLLGSVNQLLAGLALLLATLYLKRNRSWAWILTCLPCVLIIICAIWACILNQNDFYHEQEWFLLGMNGLILVVTMFILYEVVNFLLNLTKRTSVKDTPIA